MNTRWLSAALAILAFQACDLIEDRRSDRGTNDETSSFVLQNGQKATNATVEVFPAGGSDTLPTTVAYTNSEGQVRLWDLPRGYYSLVVTDKESGQASFVDSVYSDGVNMNLPSDTLRPTGSIKGRVKVQAQDDPKIAWVALVGEGNFHTIDNDSGTFLLTGIPAGRHTLVSRTDGDDYTSTFRTASVRPDSVTDVGTIELVYTGLPIVTGIVGTWDSLGGIVDLRWDASTSSKVKGYQVYRSTSNDPYSGELLGYVDSGTTTFSDTLFWRYPGNSKQLITDTSYVRYRVTTVGQTGSEGDKWNFWSDTLRRPLKVAQHPATWSKISSGLPSTVTRLDTLPGCLVALGQGAPGFDEIWKSTDGGSNWVRIRSEAASEISSMGLSAAVSHAGYLRWLRGIGSGRQAIFPSPLIPRPLLDSLRIYKMDAEGHVDSSTIAAADDSVCQARLILDSAGLVLVEGKLGFNYATFATPFAPTHRLLEGPSGNWLPGDWAEWFKIVAKPNLYEYKTSIRTVSVTGKNSIHEDGVAGTLLDLDSLTLNTASYFTYSRPDSTDGPHEVEDSPGNLTSIAWFDHKIFVLGQGTLWNVELR